MKTVKDWVALMSSIIVLAGILIGHVVPSRWFQDAISVWRFLVCVSILLLLAYGADRYIEKKIVAAQRGTGEALAGLQTTLRTLEETNKKFCDAVGQQNNLLTALDGKVANVYQLLWEHQKRPPNSKA